jgi:hypothetical protein
MVEMSASNLGQNDDALSTRSTLGRNRQICQPVNRRSDMP